MHNFPRAITKICLRPKLKDIQMFDVQAGQTYNCIIYMAKRNKLVSDNDEKFIGQGWYEYAKKKNFHCGGVLSFRMCRYTYFMYVHLRRNWCLVLEVDLLEDVVICGKVCVFGLKFICLIVNFGCFILVLCIKLCLRLSMCGWL